MAKENIKSLATPIQKRLLAYDRGGGRAGGRDEEEEEEEAADEEDIDFALLFSTACFPAFPWGALH